MERVDLAEPVLRRGILGRFGHSSLVNQGINKENKKGALWRGEMWEGAPLQKWLLPGEDQP
jgi:hypothetical protein